jgi:SAM-dependent methyltransferase
MGAARALSRPIRRARGILSPHGALTLWRPFDDVAAMSDYEESTYGERIADLYDELHSFLDTTEAAIDFLAPLAGRRRVLELGIGTGRVALGLVGRGHRVCGIDASPAMVEKLRAKPGGGSIPVTVGDFADVKVSGQFSLVYVVFNTFFGLLSQEAQIKCFQRVARRLAPDGAFVIEAFVPDLAMFDRGQRVSARHVDATTANLHAAVHDPVTQQVHGANIVLSESGTRFFPVQIRYAWPAELDLMARIAGMRLRERWGGWEREPFEKSSAVHVSVYEKVPVAEPAAQVQRRASARPVKSARVKRARGA